MSKELVCSSALFVSLRAIPEELKFGCVSVGSCLGVIMARLGATLGERMAAGDSSLRELLG